MANHRPTEIQRLGSFVATTGRTRGYQWAGIAATPMGRSQWPFAEKLEDHCRPEHRAKTHAGHHNSRDGNTSTWTTPTGHTYTTTDQPFPVEPWPTEENGTT
jgi:hypothetical protein